MFTHPLLEKYQCVFWDFDGVIKDSVEVKSTAFMKLFDAFGQNVVNRVKRHHEANQGVSRYDKLPLYLRWVGIEPSPEMVQSYCGRYSKLVKKNVIESEWVPGVLEYIGGQYDKGFFFLVTATPQLEIEEILTSLDIKHFFRRVIGAPTKKSDSIKLLLKEYSIAPENSVMIGDSTSDYTAANLNGVPFVLRCTNLNKKLQKQLECQMIGNFL